MRLAKVPPRRGAQWLALGWKVFGRKPLAFTALFAFFLFAAFALLLVPIVGPLLTLASLPLLSLGFMIATRDALADRFPAPSVFAAPFAGDPLRRRRLLVLGALYAAAAFAVFAIADAVDGGRFEELQTLLGSARPEDRDRVEALLGDGRLQLAAVLRLGLTSLLAVPFWHAPALVHWSGQGVAQSLFSSTLAVWHNRGAFAAYVLAWTALIVGFGLAVGVLAALTGAASLLAVIALPAGLTFSAVFYATLLFTFQDSFRTDDGGDPVPPAPPLPAR